MRETWRESCQSDAIHSMVNLVAFKYSRIFKALKTYGFMFLDLFKTPWCRIKNQTYFQERETLGLDLGTGEP